MGSQLVAGLGGWQPAEVAVHSYQWLADGRRVVGATSATFSPTPDELGRRIRVRIRTRVTGHHPAVATSLASPRVSAGLNTAYRRPVIDGPARVGRMLRVRPGSYSGADRRVASRWYAEDRPIPGATGRRYRLTRGDAGRRVHARVTVLARGYAPFRVRTRPTPRVTATSRHR